MLWLLRRTVWSRQRQAWGRSLSRRRKTGQRPPGPVSRYVLGYSVCMCAVTPAAVPDRRSTGWTRDQEQSYGCYALDVPWRAPPKSHTWLLSNFVPACACPSAEQTNFGTNWAQPSQNPPCHALPRPATTVMTTTTSLHPAPCWHHPTIATQPAHACLCPPHHAHHTPPSTLHPPMTQP